eukprot:51851-Rhodomonas_salina.3
MRDRNTHDFNTAPASGKVEGDDSIVVSYCVQYPVRDGVIRKHSVHPRNLRCAVTAVVDRVAKAFHATAHSRVPVDVPPLSAETANVDVVFADVKGDNHTAVVVQRRRGINSRGDVATASCKRDCADVLRVNVHVSHCAASLFPAAHEQDGWHVSGNQVSLGQPSRACGGHQGPRAGQAGRVLCGANRRAVVVCSAAPGERASRNRAVVPFGAHNALPAR